MSIPSGTVRFLGRPIFAALTPGEVRAERSRSGLFRLVEPFAVVMPDGLQVVAPAGFVSDFASVPAAAHWYVDKDAPEILYAAVIHDWLYACRGELPECTLSREQCDGIFRALMLACGARPAQAWLCHRAVRLGGGAHWEKPRPAIFPA